MVPKAAASQTQFRLTTPAGAEPNKKAALILAIDTNGNRSIIPRYRKAVVLGTHTAENHDLISSDQGSRASTLMSLLCSVRSGSMLSR